MPAEAPALLVVEDDPDDRALITRALAALRPELATATVCDGIELLALLERVTPRLVLLDLSLPRLDGREALARLRQAGAGPRVVVFTTSTEPGDRDRVLALGAADFVSKPDSFRALLASLGRILDRHLGPAA